jgi:hypothetical protein
MEKPYLSGYVRVWQCHYGTAEAMPFQDRLSRSLSKASPFIDAAT